MQVTVITLLVEVRFVSFDCHKFVDVHSCTIACVPIMPELFLINSSSVYIEKLGLSISSSLCPDLKLRSKSHIFSYINRMELDPSVPA